jgi:hypothetical protein
MKEIGMLFLATIIVASCLVVSNPVSAVMAGDSWVSKASMPTERDFIGVAVVNETIFVIGGSGPIGTNEAYDPATDTWTVKASMPESQEGFGIVACQGKIYCIGGRSTGNSDANKVYDPETDSWENKTAMPTARYGLQANVVNDKIYCIGGVRELGYNWSAGRLITQESNVNEVYDPATDTWTTKSPMPNSGGYVSAVVDSKIYVISPGLTQIYDPATDAWNAGSPPPANITRPVALPIDGTDSMVAAAAATTGAMAPKRIYVYGGSTLQIYDPQTDSWTNGTAPPTSRQYLGIGVVADKLYFIGGMSWVNPTLGLYGVLQAINEQYTPLGYGTLLEPTPAQESTPFPAVLLAASAVLITLVAIGIAVYVKRCKR